MSSKKTAFDHPTRLRHDPRIMKIRGEYGMEGYARYLMLLEILASQPKYRYPITPLNLKAMSKELDIILVKQLTDFIDVCIDAELLIEDDTQEWISCPELTAEMLTREKSRKQKSNAARAGWKKRRIM